MSRNLVTDFSKVGVREEGLTYYFSFSNLLKTILAFMPPKPNEFEMANCISDLLA